MTKMGVKKIRHDKTHPAEIKIRGHLGAFRVTVGGKERSYPVSSGFGYFISVFRKAASLTGVAALVDKGIAYHEIQNIIRYFDLKIPEIAKAASVSVSTVSRWETNSSIGTPGSAQFFRMDEIVRKGIALFGGEEDLRRWLTAPNMALGNATPVRLMTSNPGIDLVDEAMDALAYGNVL